MTLFLHFLGDRARYSRREGDRFLWSQGKFAQPIEGEGVLICLGFAFDEQLVRQIFQVDNLGGRGSREVQERKGSRDSYVRSHTEGQDLDYNVRISGHIDQVRYLLGHHIGAAYLTLQRAFIQDYPELQRSIASQQSLSCQASLDSPGYLAWRSSEKANADDFLRVPAGLQDSRHEHLPVEALRFRILLKGDKRRVIETQRIAICFPPSPLISGPSKFGEPFPRRAGDTVVVEQIT